MRANRISETELGREVLKLAHNKPSGFICYVCLKDEIENLGILGPEDQKPSETRANENVWEQQIRNLVSHKHNPGNIIHEGYAEHIPSLGFRITDSGQNYLNSQNV